MYKINKDSAKKSIKQIMVISTVATLLMAFMGSMPVMKSYAFNLGSDRTDSLLGCFGVGVDCNKTNKDNNNHHTDILTRIINNTIGKATPITPVTNITKPVAANETLCATCFTSFLNPTQLGNLKFVLGVPVAGTNAQLCTVVQTLTASELRTAIVMPVVGVTDAVATNIINCLITAGYTNLSA
jgi:hypothetical protein